MKKDQYGIWEIIVPPTTDGKCAIEHESKLKARCSTPCPRELWLMSPHIDIHDSLAW
jgi:hypothetical protein